MNLERGDRLWSLFEKVPEGICISDQGGAFLYANPAAGRLLDALPQELGARPLCELLCGRLSVCGQKDCASRCPLRDPLNDDPALSLQGVFEAPRPTHYKWRDFTVKRFEKYRDYRVCCVRLRLAWLDPKGVAKHLTIIEDVSERTPRLEGQQGSRMRVESELGPVLKNLVSLLETLEPVAERPAAAGENMRRVEDAEGAAARLLTLLETALNIPPPFPPNS